MSAVAATVLIRGDGVSVATAVRLLRCDGLELAGAGETVRSPAPVVMLSEAALALLRDIFGRPDLFGGGAPIARRIVAWGGGEPAILPHKAIVVTGAELTAELPLPPLPAPDGDVCFTLRGTPPFPDGGVRHFGRRGAMAVAVDLVAQADRQACHIEAIESGWLFLIPCGAGKAWLLGVGDALDVLLGQSRLVSAQIGTIGPVAARFETAPRMLENLVGHDWLACGTTAIAFDPICGDGTAQAAREAVLAAAVIAGIKRSGGGEERSALLGHYQAMLLAAMRRHLQISLPFYRSGGTSPWWREQAAAVADGHAWCTARLATMPEPRFMLRGARLVPRELAA
ncbi:hypothetical protein GCM10009087_11600 [Sphingomonas oligophenolica]|uniref:Uncharacterized protein n=1 Tax=Sphingomonas oligophenolica TaxID=301154 RepID=A0ABU9Y437_9SPHN